MFLEEKANFTTGKWILEIQIQIVQHFASWDNIEAMWVCWADFTDVTLAIDDTYGDRVRCGDGDPIMGVVEKVADD